MSAGDKSWERVRQSADFVLEFGGTTRYRTITRPKDATTRALLGGSDFVSEEDYRIEDGHFVQSCGDSITVSRVVWSPEDDEIVLERVRVHGWGRSWDDSELGQCKVVLRRLRE
jgi:hypothetical protein